MLYYSAGGDILRRAIAVHSILQGDITRITESISAISSVPNAVIHIP